MIILLVPQYLYGLADLRIRHVDSFGIMLGASDANIISSDALETVDAIPSQRRPFSAKESDCEKLDERGEDEGVGIRQPSWVTRDCVVCDTYGFDTLGEPSR